MGLYEKRKGLPPGWKRSKKKETQNMAYLISYAESICKCPHMCAC